jgi:hypothetical protein
MKGESSLLHLSSLSLSTRHFFFPLRKGGTQTRSHGSLQGVAFHGFLIIDAAIRLDFSFVPTPISLSTPSTCRPPTGAGSDGLRVGVWEEGS